MDKASLESLRTAVAEAFPDAAYVKCGTYDDRIGGVWFYMPDTNLSHETYFQLDLTPEVTAEELIEGFREQITAAQPAASSRASLD
jgi:hypothetical protein